MKNGKYFGFATLLTIFVLNLSAAEPVQKNSLPRICVLDFVSPDVKGHEQFLNSERKPVRISTDCTLSDSDRVSMNSIMQGYVRMIDARDTSKTNDVNRELRVRDYNYDRAKELELYKTVVRGESRPLLLGADYLTGYLGKHSEVVTCFPSEVMYKVMRSLETAPDFPQDFMIRLSQHTGATHVIYGSISDIRQKFKQFKGYGIQTKSIVYELDVIVKLVDLPAQRIVYSNIFTGSLKEKDMSTGGIEIDGNRYQTLMKSAMEQVADEIAQMFKNKKLQVPAIPSAKTAPAASSVPVQKPAEKTAKTTVLPPLPPKREKVIIEQRGRSVIGKDGLPVAPSAPVPVPVAGDGPTIIITEPAVRRNVTVIDQNIQTGKGAVKK